MNKNNEEKFHVSELMRHFKVGLCKQSHKKCLWHSRKENKREPRNECSDEELMKDPEISMKALRNDEHKFKSLTK